MRINLLISLFILAVLAIALAHTDFPGAGDIVLDMLVLTILSSALAFQLWLRSHIFD